MASRSCWKVERDTRGKITKVMMSRALERQQRQVPHRLVVAGDLVGLHRRRRLGGEPLQQQDVVVERQVDQQRVRDDPLRKNENQAAHREGLAAAAQAGHPHHQGGHHQDRRRRGDELAQARPPRPARRRPASSNTVFMVANPMSKLAWVRTAAARWPSPRTPSKASMPETGSGPPDQNQRRETGILVHLGELGRGQKKPTPSAVPSNCCRRRPARLTASAPARRPRR